MNQGEKFRVETDEEHVIFTLNKPLKFTFDALKGGQYFNFNKPDVNNSSEYNSPIIYYDWLVDSAMTSHITNQHEAFTTFHLLTGTTVSWVGNIKAKAAG